MFFKKVIALLIILIFAGCSDRPLNTDHSQEKRVSVAFMADVHFHDVFAEFQDGSFSGLPVTVNGDTRLAAIRTMESQLTSTRLFNENYFAFRAALDDVVNRGIQFVAFPGDFSDDGQPVHVRGFRNILDEYHQNHGIEFFIITGNHDPGRPFSTPAGKFNYLGEKGKRQPVFSSEHPVCTGEDSRGIATEMSHGVICTDEVKHYGYEELLNELGYHGMIPKENYIYFETPFSSYNMDNYGFDTALDESSYANRLYEICSEGAGGQYREDHFTNCFDVMDMSYLAEPAVGLWLLAIDGNVYIPNQNADTILADNPRNFGGPGNAGYNAIVTHKSHLIEWIEDVAKRAKKHGKQLVAFSHYPAVDFYNDASDEIKELWGHGRFQTLRLPDAEVSNLLANTGLQLHVGGHMHMNDTGMAMDEITGNRLYNIQAPSIAGYVPAYKILHFSQESKVEIETIVLENVPGFDTLFALYQKEWDLLDDYGVDGIWNRDVLTASNYYEFSDWHMRELSRLRFLPNEWPQGIRDKLETMTGKDILLSTLPSSHLLKEEEADSIINQYGYTARDFENWDGMNLSVDFYRIRNAGSLAFADIPADRLNQYAILNDMLNHTEIVVSDDNHLFRTQFGLLFSVMKKFATGYPDDHFLIDLDEGSIRSLKEISNPFLGK